MDASKIRIGRKLISAGALAVSVARIALTAGAAVASARPRYYAVSSETACLANRDINPLLRANRANVVRLILSPQDALAGAGVACVQQADTAGFKIYISLQFKNRWTPADVAAYIRQVLPTYAPYVWAVGVGNEQDLSMPNPYGQGTASLTTHGRSAGASYRAIWNVVEPVLVSLVPHAIRVYGEFSPWSFNATQQGFASSRPRGVQAIAAHCYDTKVGGLMQVPQDAAWAASKRLPLWCSEMGPALPRRTTPKWMVPQTWASWNALVGKIVRKSPDLQMSGYYYDPAL